jgi:hypothetical protein
MRVGSNAEMEFPGGKIDEDLAFFGAARLRRGRNQSGIRGCAEGGFLSVEEKWVDFIFSLLFVWIGADSCSGSSLRRSGIWAGGMIDER